MNSPQLGVAEENAVHVLIHLFEPDIFVAKDFADEEPIPKATRKFRDDVPMSSPAYPSTARSNTFQKIVVRTTAGMEFPDNQLSLGKSKIHPDSALAIAHEEFPPTR